MKLSFRVVSFVSLFSLIHCLSIRTGEYVNSPTVSKFELKKNVALKIQSEYLIIADGQPESSSNESLTKTWYDDAVKVLSESTDISISPSQSDYDFLFDIKVTEQTSKFSQVYSRWISLATIGLFPYYKKATFDMTLQVKDPKGKVLGEVKRREEMKEFGHLFLIFTIPFLEPNVEAIRIDFLRSASAEIKEKGYLKK